MQPHPLPEMLRLSLQDLYVDGGSFLKPTDIGCHRALRIKILRVRLGATISEALALALDPPAPLNVMRAVNSLVEVGALKGSDESITPLGRLLSKLPVDVHLGEQASNAHAPWLSYFANRQIPPLLGDLPLP